MTLRTDDTFSRPVIAPRPWCKRIMRQCASAMLVAFVLLGLPKVALRAQQYPSIPDSLYGDPRSAAHETGDGATLLDQVVDPAQYRIGPGDQLSFQIAGTTSSTMNVLVTPEASVIIPSIGTISVRGMTLGEAKSEIRTHLGTYYPKAEITVTLTAVRRFRVPVIGAVKFPGAQTVTASTRASEAVSASKPGSEASMRGVMLLRGNDTLSVDLTAYYRLGRTHLNPYLTEGDVLLVPSLSAKWHSIQVSGSVKDEGEFEFRPGDRVGDLIDLGFGLAPDADTTRLELWRFGSASDSMMHVTWPAGTTISDWISVPLAPDDHLVVRSTENYHEESSVTIFGEVRRPGVYVFSGRQMALSALVDSAGGFAPGADLANSRILRTTVPVWEGELRKRLELTPEPLRSQSESDWILADALSVPGRISTDFVKLFREGDSSYDVMLSDGDRVEIPRQSIYVNVIGRVVQPGRVAYVPDGRVDYYLQSAGGYAWRANRGGTFLIKGGTGAAVKKSDVKSIEPGDIIVVPTVRDRDIWKSVKDVLAVAANLATVYLVIDQATQ